jgi:hypothetical protein
MPVILDIHFYENAADILKDSWGWLDHKINRWWRNMIISALEA